jgi:hypothetical protein
MLNFQPILRACVCITVALTLGDLSPIAFGEDIVIKTSTGRGADAEVRKNANNQSHDAGRGAAEDLNARYNPTPGKERNEIILLRFDLSKIKPEQIKDARIELTSFASPKAANILLLYGLQHSAENQDWDETTITFSNAPGLQWDNDLTTRGLVNEKVVYLGTLNSPIREAGTVLQFKNEALIKYLRDTSWKTRTADPGLISFIILAQNKSSGQHRFRSKEYLDEDDADAPRLIVTVE